MTLVSTLSMQCLLKELLYDSLNSEGLKVGIIIDEMKIKSRSVFNKSSGKLLNLGDVNNTLLQLEKCLTTFKSHMQAEEVATHMLVIMIRAMTQPSFTFPVAQQI